MKKAELLAIFFIFANLGALPCYSQTALVPGGNLKPFWIKPQKNGKTVEIKIPSLNVQIHQVTNSEFQFFLKAHPEWTKSHVSPLFAEAGYLSQFKNDLSLAAHIHKQAPVTSVSWFAASAYCQSLGYRLPKITEWEFLAAASEKSKDANKDPAFLERILNWYGQPQIGSLANVKSIYKNIYGLYDLHGLVWEWVEDFNSSFGTGESREDTSFNRDLFCGAGSINSGDKENYAAFMRFAFRSSLKGTSSLWNLGFRCVKEEPL